MGSRRALCGDRASDATIADAGVMARVRKSRAQKRDARKDEAAAAADEPMAAHATCLICGTVSCAPTQVELDAIENEIRAGFDRDAAIERVRAVQMDLGPARKRLRQRVERGEA
jgi:hypothetical protein